MTHCDHKWISSEGKTASGVICAKCWDYTGPQKEQRVKIKVLPNPYQTSVKIWQWKNIRRAKEGLEPIGFDLVEHYPAHDVVYNRVGFYMTQQDCWLEFDMGEGIIKAITYDRETFMRHLKEKQHNEKPINKEDWDTISRLLDRGLISWTEKFQAESWRHRSRLLEIDSGKRLIAMRKRIKAKTNS